MVLCPFKFNRCAVCLIIVLLEDNEIVVLHKVFRCVILPRKSDTVHSLSMFSLNRCLAVSIFRCGLMGTWLRVSMD